MSPMGLTNRSHREGARPTLAMPSRPSRGLARASVRPGPGALGPPPWPWSERVRGHDLATGDGPQRPPDRRGDRVLDEPDRPVPREQMDSAGVAAGCGHDDLAADVVVGEVAAHLVRAGNVLIARVEDVPVRPPLS